MENKYISSLLALKAEDILNVSLDRPEALFSNIKTLDELKYSYRKLISVWHPDPYPTGSYVPHPCRILPTVLYLPGHLGEYPEGWHPGCSTHLHVPGNKQTG